MSGYEVKPGVKTSEFAILVALLCFAVIALALGKDEIATMAMGAAGLTGGGYALSRGMVKG